MKVAIIEDEQLSADHLNMLLQRIDNKIEVVMHLDSVKAAVKAFQDGLKADLIFLDIHLADGNSFEIFNQIQLDIPIIFTTAFDNYAIRAFKQNSIDYLLKPISKNELIQAIEKFKKNQPQSDNRFLENIYSVFSEGNVEFKTQFLVKMGETISTIHTNDIHYFETDESITFIRTIQGKRFIVDLALMQLEKILNPRYFFRINRKVIIRINAIEQIKTYPNSRLMIFAPNLEGDAQIVSRERVIDFKKWLDR